MKKVFQKTILLLSLSLILTRLDGAPMPVVILYDQDNSYSQIENWFVSKNIIGAGLNSIHFHGKTITDVHNRTAIISDDNLFAIMLLQPEKLQSHISLQIYESNGEQKAAFIQNWPFDIPPPQLWLNSGKKEIIEIDLTGAVHFVNFEGRIIREFTLADNYKYNSENQIHSCVDFKHQRIYAVITEPKTDASGNVIYYCVVHSFDFSGEILNSREFIGYQALALGFSETTGRIALSLAALQEGHFKTVIYDEALNFLAEIAGHASQLIIDNEGKKILIINSKSVQLYDVNLQQILWQKEPVNGGNIFLTGVFWNGDNPVSLLEGSINPDALQSAQKWSFTNLVLRTLTNQDLEISKILFKELVVYTPVLKFIDAEDALFLGHSQGWKKFILR